VSLIVLDAIRLDGGTQPRAETDGTLVEDYAQAMLAGAVFPAVTVYHDGQSRWLAGGFHRFHARRLAGFLDIDADVRQGTRRDAVLFSVGENAEHGLRRTNEDKNRAVRKLLEDEEWRACSNEQCAAKARVDATFVADIRDQMYPPSPGEPEMRQAKRGGTVYQMDTTNIGRQPQQQLWSPPSSSSRPAGHREHEERPRFLAVAETMHTIVSAHKNLPDPQTTATEIGGFDLDEAYRISLWWTKFAAHLRQRVERAS
jgi:hypothetical protein